jgi:hypothetical protein
MTRRLLHGLPAAALAGFLLAAVAALMLHRQARTIQTRVESRQRLLAALEPDLARLDRYESIERAIRDALHRDAPLPALPPGVPDPDQRETKRLPAAGGWRGLQMELGWPRIATRHALEALSFCATNPAAWRLAHLQIEALETAGNCRLQLTLERVEASVEE